MNEQKKGIGKLSVIIIVLLALVIVIMAAVVIKLAGDRGTEVDNNDSRGELVNRGFIDAEHTDDVIEDMASKVAEGMFECRMSMHWTFEDGTAVAEDAYVANSENNTYTIYFDLLDSEGEVLYASPYMPVGSEIQGIKLDKELDAGEYEATVKYHLVRETEDGGYEDVSSAGFIVTLTVLN